jgi:hypothetical protein
MSPTAENDQELSLALERVIAICREQITLAQQHRTAAMTVDDRQAARIEERRWELSLENLLEAQRMRKR